MQTLLMAVGFQQCFTKGPYLNDLTAKLSRGCGSLALSDECDCQEMISRIRKLGEHGVSEGPVHPTVWKSSCCAPLPVQGSRRVALQPALMCKLLTSLLKHLGFRQGEDVSLHGG